MGKRLDEGRVFFLCKILKPGGVHLQIQKIKVRCTMGKEGRRRREEKKIEKKFDCTQRAVLI